ncbi:MAG TPA: PsiF family protein [Casimicrobiaceae bacterium]|nr:PsiF family protein [Casimicrobiaceae bacterium]
MTKILTLGLAVLFASGQAFAATAESKMAVGTAATADTKMNSQQSKMATCQAQATEKKLESTARQDYVNNCLKAKPVAEKPESKMAMCNKKTAGMKADERAKAQSECMKG